MSCRLACKRTTAALCISCAAGQADSRTAFLAGLAMGSAGTDVLIVGVCGTCEKALADLIAFHNVKRERS